MKFEDEYMGVLQNIEAMIITVYREQDESFSDHSVSRALEAAIDEMVALKINRQPRDFRLDEVETDILRAITGICLWRLGKVGLVDENDEDVEIDFEPNTPQEIIDCLKRIQMSVKFWNNQNGRQGYLNYASKFV
jgi:hypothetical protein